MKKIIGVIALILGAIFTAIGIYGVLRSYFIGIVTNSFDYILGIVISAGLSLIFGISLIRYGFKKIYEKTPNP